MDRPDLDVAALRDALGTRWNRVDVVGEVASTNSELLAAGDTAPDRTLLAAEYQRAGRGRFDRVWSSPRGAGITASFGFRPRAPLATYGWVPLLAGLAVAEAVGEVIGADAMLKWPNDVLLGDLKLAGILAQSAAGAVVVGIGCNVSTTADELPPGVPATSLALAGADVDRTALLVGIATRLDARVAQWDDCDGDAAACGLAAAYRERCATLGRGVRVTLADGSALEGEAHEVDDAGHLVVVAGGERHLVAAGDVEHLRDAAGNR